MARGLGDRVEASLGVLLLRRNRRDLYRELTEGVASGVTATTYPVISAVSRLGPVTATELAPEVGLDRTVTSRYATQLVDHGLLRRCPDPADPRRSLLTLTAEGEAVVATMRRRLVETIDGQLATWPPEDARSFVAGLERFTRELRMRRRAGDQSDAT
jgi:DNA-binding MarR family transcriptional regulator